MKKIVPFLWQHNFSLYLQHTFCIATQKSFSYFLLRKKCDRKEKGLFFVRKCKEVNEEQREKRWKLCIEIGTNTHSSSFIETRMNLYIYFLEGWVSTIFSISTCTICGDTCFIASYIQIYMHILHSIFMYRKYSHI